MKELLEKYMEGDCNTKETQLLLQYFEFSDHEEKFSKVIMHCLNKTSHLTSVPVTDRVYDQMRSGEWKETFREETGILHRKIKTEYIAAGVLICLFIVLMFFLFNDKIQYDRTWKTEVPKVDSAK